MIYSFESSPRVYDEKETQRILPAKIESFSVFPSVFGTPATSVTRDYLLMILLPDFNKLLEVCKNLAAFHAEFRIEADHKEWVLGFLKDFIFIGF